MFRAKLYLFLLGIVFAFLAVSLSLVNGHRGVVLDAARKDMSTLPDRYDQTIELRFHQLREIGHELSGSVLGAYLYTLREYRDQMRDMEKEMFSADFAADHPDENLDEARAAAIKEDYDSFLESFANTLADKIVMTRPKYFDDKTPREEFIEQTETMMVNCMASALDTCYFKATYFPLHEEAVPEIEKAHPDVNLDFAIVLDDRGIGRAHSRDPKWSGKQKFADKYPVVFAARTNPDRVYRDIVYFEDNEKYFLVSVVPLKSDAKLLGFLVIGSALDTAIKADATLMNADLSFFAADKVISTTLPKGQRVEELKAAGRGKGANAQFQTSTLLAASATLDGNYSNNSVRAVFSRDISGLIGFVDSSVLWLIVACALVFVIGLIVFQIFISQFMKPLEEIETGIHRIISGDKEYYFQFEYRESIAKSLAETMNLMVAVLLGKPLPEEEDEAEFMEEALSFADGSTGEFKKLDAPSHEKTTLFEMDPDEYYKHLYKEFVDAHETLGNDMSRMTRLKFVEKIANNETQLRLRTGKSQVRFTVQVKNKEVQLHPNFVE